LLLLKTLEICPLLEVLHEFIGFDFFHQDFFHLEISTEIRHVSSASERSLCLFCGMKDLVEEIL